MSAKYTVRQLRDQDFPAWEAFVAASPQGSPYALPAYLDALAAAAGGNFRLLGVERDGQLVGGVPLYERRDTGGRFVAPRLLLYYLSPLLAPDVSSYPSVRTARAVHVLGSMAEALCREPYAHLTLKWRHTLTDVRPFLAAGWSARTSYSYCVDIRNLGEAWDRVEQNLRRLVSRCGDQGMTCSEDDDIQGFLRLHAITLGRRGASTYLPEAVFPDFYRRLRTAGLCRLYQARLPTGQLVASQLVLAGGHAVTHTVSAGADPEFLKQGGSAFLRWKAFEALSTAGFTHNDLTDAALNSVTHFKSQLGGELVMCPVVESPGSMRWRLAGSVRNGRERAKGVVKRLLGRGRE